MVRIDLRSETFKEAPELTWQWLHNISSETGGLIQSRQPLLGRLTLITDYNSCRTMLTDTDRFSLDARRSGHKQPAGMRWWVPRLFRPLANNLLTTDGAEHRDLRHRVDDVFKRKALTNLEKFIHTTIDEAIGRLFQTIKQQGYADFVGIVSKPIPQMVISHILGLDESHTKPGSELSCALSKLGGIVGPIDLISAIPAIKTITTILQSEILHRRLEPRDDLLSQLVQQDGIGRPLQDNELLSMTFLLYVAGHETTTNLLSMALWSMLFKPQVAKQLSWPIDERTIHELNRLFSPVQLSKPRFIVEDTKLADVSLKKGQTIAALIGAANQDPKVFNCPDQFDSHRASSKQLAFGAGPHTCLGLNLAVRETLIVLNRLHEHPALQPANTSRDYQWTKRLGLRSLSYLQVTH